MSAGFSFDPTGLLQGLTQTESKADVAIRMYAEQSALKLQNYAKEHRRWTDRTGHARQRLTGSSAKITTGYRLQLAHGVDYGLWLELAKEKICHHTRDNQLCWPKRDSTRSGKAA